MAADLLSTHVFDATTVNTCAIRRTNICKQMVVRIEFRSFTDKQKFSFLFTKHK